MNEFALNAALDAIASHCTDAVMAAKLRALMRGYAVRWAQDDYQVAAVESFVRSDMYNPESKRTSRTFQLAGKMDVNVADHTGLTVLIDHKTTSDDIEDPMSSYWKQLVIEGQANHYMLLEWLNGRKVDYALWDVVRKPSISPRQITKAEQKELTISGTYFGSSFVLEEVTAALELGRETPALYEARLADDCLVQRPLRYFQRRRLPRLDAEIAEYAQELWEHGQEIIEARRKERWMRNSGACMNYGSACRFLDICSGHDTPDSDRWAQKKWMHPELVQIEGLDGRGLLTNSRIRSFQTCRRKHYYEFELGIERVEAEDKESLIFGDLWHKAQEAYWGVIQNQQLTENQQEKQDATITIEPFNQPASNDSGKVFTF